MTPDQKYALGLGVASLLLLVPAVRHPVLETVSNPVVAVLGGLVILGAATKGMPLVAVVLVAIALFLVRETRTTYKMSSVERQLYLDKLEDDARFNSAYSVDLQVANRTLGFEAPRMLAQDHDATPLLKFPPSQATLDELSGR